VYLINNPLDNTNSDLNTIIPTAPDGSLILLWSEAAIDFSPTSPQYSTFSHAWNPDVTITPGEGFYVSPAQPFTNTFIGNVRQQTVTQSVLGGGTIAAIGSTVPLGGGVTNQLASYPALDGDIIQLWDPVLGDFSATAPQYSTFSHAWNPDHVFTPGDAFFLLRNGGPVTWTRTFTVQ
jgi:hypothetical protein